MIEEKIKQRLAEFIQAVERSVADESFAKMSLGNYQGETTELKKLLIKRILLKSEWYWNITYRYRSRDVVKNVADQEGLSTIKSFIEEGFRIATLFTLQFDLIYENIHNKKIVLRKTAPSHTEAPSSQHDNNKIRAIPPDTFYLRALGISDKHGKVYKASQDKYRQLNHYIHMLESVLRDFKPGSEIYVSDMGSGKGYLTFALYDYMRKKLKLNVQVTGVEMRKDLVTLCEDIAKKNGFDKLNFVEGSIQSYNPPKLNVLVALHACDTATDDAIFKGIKAGAEIIVTAPCCHKQIRRELEANKPSNDLDYLMKYGIFLERQAEMVTDGIRSLVLEYFGYKVKVAEFISDAHTPKNVMIVAIKTNREAKSDETILQNIKSAMAYFSIKEHHLVKALGI